MSNRYLKGNEVVIYIRPDSSRCGWVGRIKDVRVGNRSWPTTYDMLYMNGVRQQYRIRQTFIHEYFVKMEDATLDQLEMAMATTENMTYMHQLSSFLRQKLSSLHKQQPAEICKAPEPVVVADPDLDKVGEFYCMVDGSTTAPRVSHKTKRIALVEAERLAKEHTRKVKVLCVAAEVEVIPTTIYEVKTKHASI